MACTQAECCLQFGLDDRLMRALYKMVRGLACSVAGCSHFRQGFKRPTVVQSGSIKLAQEGKDILARARTGSGKTVAYGIPLVDRLLKAPPSLPPVAADTPSRRQRKVSTKKA